MVEKSQSTWSRSDIWVEGHSIIDESMVDKLGPSNWFMVRGFPIDTGGRELSNLETNY